MQKITLTICLLVLASYMIGCQNMASSQSVEHDVNIIPLPQEMALTKPLKQIPDLEKVQFVHDSSIEGEEAYVLEVTKRKITVRASSETGYFYGMQTLRQEVAAGAVYRGVIKDAPRYGWRGYMLDESRHFFGMEKVKQILDIMAYYKLNRFHWHLTDAPGWRIEIKAFPELTRAGAVGNFSDPDAPAAFYTQEQIREIVQYAAERHIEVIPEIDMPGHATASNRAYPAYSGGGTEKNPDFTFNPGKEETYAYLGQILTELAGLFPSHYIHIGGDEVSFGSEAWNADADVQALMTREGLNTLKEVEGYFIRRMADKVHQLGKVMMGWDDMMECGISSEQNALLWWRHDKPERLQAMIDGGFPVVLCPRRPLYLDFVQHESHQVGRRWNGFCPLEDVYAFPQKDDPHILGMQGNAWTEHIHTMDRLDFMTFPRLIAMSEAAWTQPDRKDYDDFCRRLEQAYLYLDQQHVFYFDTRNPQRHAEPAGPVMKERKPVKMDYKD